MNREINWDRLSKANYFDRDELFLAMKSVEPDLTESNFKARLQKLLQSEEIGRVGRNAYCVCKKNLRLYSHEYSELANNLATFIRKKHEYLDFRIFELVQLNEFLNHQIAHNIIFLSIEADLQDFVFDELNEKYERKVFIDPTLELFHRYMTDDMIVIDKLPSEAPKGRTEFWHTDLEKLLVDTMNDEIIGSTFDKAELQTVFENAFENYIVDESRLFRYARRRSVEREMRTFIKENTDVMLRLGQKNDHKGKL